MDSENCEMVDVRDDDDDDDVSLIDLVNNSPLSKVIMNRWS